MEIKIDGVLFDCVWIEFYTRDVVSFFELFIFKHCKFSRDWRESKFDLD